MNGIKCVERVIDYCNIAVTTSLLEEILIEYCVEDFFFFFLMVKAEKRTMWGHALENLLLWNMKPLVIPTAAYR